MGLYSVRWWASLWCQVSKASFSSSSWGSLRIARLVDGVDSVMGIALADITVKERIILSDIPNEGTILRPVCGVNMPNILPQVFWHLGKTAESPVIK